MEGIQVLLITGFLGAGKTTLLKMLLEEYKSSKIGVVINEFGKISIDGRLIQRNGIEMAEVNNGSIFCSCLKENFVKALIEMSKLELDHILIEASGLADPSSMSTLLEGIKDKLGKPFEYKGSLCVIDGEHFTGMADMLIALNRQVEYSRVVLLNKVDLLSEEEEKNVHDLILKINPEAVVIPTTYCRVDLNELMERLSMMDIAPVESSNTPDNRPRTFLLKNLRPVDPIKLQGFLKEIGQYAYRIKGFVETTEGLTEVSCVGSTVELLPWEKEEPEKELVVISSVEARIIRLIVDGMERHLNGEISF